MLKIFHQQRGYALAITLMVLAAITVLGVISMNIICVEINLSRNERDIQRSFYSTEAAAHEGLQRLSNSSHDDLNDHVYIWHHVRDSQKGIDFRKPEEWITHQEDEVNVMQSILDSQSYFAAVEWDVAAGASLVMTESRLYVNRIYGLNKQFQNNAIIEIGFYLRY